MLRGDVVAAEHRDAPVQEAVTQRETRLDQGVPRLGPADAVDPEAAPVLERLESGAGGRAEDAQVVGACGEPQARQAVLHVGHRLTAVPLPQGEDIAGPAQM
jgi:hypothetical protein